MTDRPCIKCRFFVLDKDNFKLSKCILPAADKAAFQIFGSELSDQYSGSFANLNRKYERCGPEGRFFEPIPEKQTT